MSLTAKFSRYPLKIHKKHVDFKQFFRRHFYLVLDFMSDSLESVVYTRLPLPILGNSQPFLFCPFSILSAFMLTLNFTFTLYPAYPLKFFSNSFLFTGEERERGEVTDNFYSGNKRRSVAPRKK